MTYGIQEALEEMRRGNHGVAAATLILLWRSGHQFAIDGSWKIAWRMTGLTHPFQQSRFAGPEGDLATIAGVMRAEEDLDSKLKNGPFPTRDKEKGKEEDGDGERLSWKAKKAARKKAAAKEKA